MKKILVAILGALLSVTMLVPAQSNAAVPTQALFPGNYVRHNADDAGYNDPIKVRCTDSTYRWLGLGVSSNMAGKCPNGVDYVFPEAGTKTLCSVPTSNNIYVFSYGGDNYLWDNSFYCVQQLA